MRFLESIAAAYAEGVEIIQPRVDATQERLPWENLRQAPTLKGLYSFGAIAPRPGGTKDYSRGVERSAPPGTRLPNGCTPEWVPEPIYS